VIWIHWKKIVFKIFHSTKSFWWRRQPSLLFSITSKINVAVYRIKAPYYYFESIYVSSENKLFLQVEVVFLVIY
jgi:hypothetical protein